MWSNARTLKLAAAPSILAIAIAALVLATLPGEAAAQEAKVRRFALVIGANDGGSARATLRFAATDASAVQSVLTEFGGVNSEDAQVLLQPDVATLEQALGVMAQRLEGARDGQTRTELIFFYSGHSDDQGLLLAGERMPYKKLRLYIQSMPADVRVAVLDSCSSGTLTRTKGGDRTRPFLIDDSTEVKGYAFLTSSSADEAAQESDRVGGSFFTHSFITGLRGAADATGDGRVTLTEAYDFAFRETLARTETTAAGPQHAAYDIQLSGSGDLVLSDLRGVSSRLVLPRKLRGRLYVRDANGHLVAELFKAEGREVELGLDAGEYTITLDDQGELRQGRAAVDAGGRTTLDPNALTALTAEATASRGGEGAPDAAPPEGLFIPFDLGIIPGVQLSGVTDEGPVTRGLQLNLLVSATDRLEGGQGALIGNIVREDAAGVQGSVVFNIVGGELTGGQYTSVFNYAGGDVNGLQISSAFNYAGGDMNLGQITAAANILGGDLNGTQVAAGANIAGGHVQGLQIAAGTNIAGGGVNGLQIAAGANIAGGPVQGAQIAAATNVTDSIDGAQISVINIGGTVNGAQVGVINIGGTVDGAQVGVINIAGELHGPPIGLLNFIGNGQLHLDVWSDDITPINTGIRFGSKHFYTALAFGTSADSDAIWHAMLGIGGHITLDPLPLFVDIDAFSSQLHKGEGWDERANSLHRLRLGVGWQILDHLAIYGGGSLNVFIADEPDRRDFHIGPEVSEDAVGTTLSIWPGFYAGVQF